MGLGKIGQKWCFGTVCFDNNPTESCMIIRYSTLFQRAMFCPKIY